MNRTFDVTDPLYRIRYFLTVENAKAHCLAPSPKFIYIVQDWHDVSNLVIANRNAYESLYLIGIGNPVLIGADIAISATASTKFNLTLHGLHWVNPAGLTGYTSTYNQNILWGNDVARLFNLTITNSSFYAQQPLVPLSSLPQNYTAWIEYLGVLTSAPVGVVPYIRAPNTNLVINVALEGKSIIY